MYIGFSKEEPPSEPPPPPNANIPFPPSSSRTHCVLLNGIACAQMFPSHSAHAVPVLISGTAQTLRPGL